MGMKAGVQRTSVIFMESPRRSALIGERLPLCAGGHATDMPSAEICEIELIEAVASEGGISRAGEHGGVAIGGEQAHVSTGRYTIDVVRGVAGDVQVSLCVEGRAVGNTVEGVRVDVGLPNFPRRENRNSEHVVARALYDVECV